MTPFPVRLGKVAALALACAIASGCESSTSERTAGGEDFPNTLDALGRALAEAIDSSGDWNRLEETSVSTSSSSGLPDTTPLVAGRMVAFCEPDTVWGALDDGFVFQRSVRCSDGGRVQDSLVIRPADSLVRLLVRDSSGPLGLVRKIETFAPDSGTAFRLKGYAGRIRMNTLGIRGRWRLASELVLDAGADLDWDTDQDNDLYRGGQATIRDERDTVDRWAVTPWPAGTRPVYSRRTGDSGLALLERRQILSSGAVRGESSVLMAFRADSLNYPLRSRATTTWPGSARMEESIQGLRADSLFRPGDSALYLRRWTNGQDSLREEIVLRSSPSPRDRGGDRLLSLSSARHRSRSSEVATEIRAVPSPPLPPGKEFTDGSVSLVVVRSNGETIRFQGTMAGGITTGRWSTGRDSGSVRMGAGGEVLGSGP